MQKFKLILGNLLVIIAMSGFSQAKKNKIMEEKYYFKTTVTGNINDVRQKNRRGIQKQNLQSDFRNRHARKAGRKAGKC
jgi:hypothetical protein